MNKRTSGALALVIVWGAGLYMFGNVSDVPNASLGKQTAFILDENGCEMCHSRSAKLPFYADIPLVGALIKYDVAEGLEHFDIAPLVEKLEKDVKPSSLEIEKIEYAIKANAMPPMRYRLFHWKSGISPEEFDIIDKWIAFERKALPNPAGSAEHVAESPNSPAKKCDAKILVKKQ